MRAFVKNLIKDESGVTAIEYGMIAALIAVVIVAVMATLSTGLTTAFNSISSAL